MMTMTRKLSRITRAAMVLMTVSALSACDSILGSDDDDDDGHNEAVGMVITDQNNTTLVSVNASRQVTGTLTVARGAARHIEVYFVDEDGDRFQVDGDDHTLDWTVANTGIAAIDSHGDHLDLDGVAAGSTTVVFSIMHGNHSDYDSPNIPITVTP